MNGAAPEITGDAEVIDIVSRKLGGSTLSEALLESLLSEAAVCSQNRWTKGNRLSFLVAFQRSEGW